ncbi:hypothetical protein [Dyella jejuensis]
MIAWVVMQTNISLTPVLALISAFDGDGWIMSGRTSQFLPVRTIN